MYPYSMIALWESIDGNKSAEFISPDQKQILLSDDL